MNYDRFFRLFALSLVAAVFGADSMSYSQEAVEKRVATLSLTDATSSDSQTQSTGTTASPNAATDNDWHLAIAPYLWFPGVHGTVGALGHEASIDASPGDLLSHFRFGLMGLVEARHKQLLLPIDIVWVRLGDDKALPAFGLGAITANAKASVFILTPKIGFRVLDEDKIKFDGLMGFRYWHLGQNLHFNPSILGLDFSGSQNWVDPLVGGRLQINLTPKVDATIAGDVGGWGVGSQLDYQVVGLLGYKIKPRWTLQAGYRYLDVNYRSRTVFDVATSGVLFGVSITLK
jgi:hypothetical protein